MYIYICIYINTSGLPDIMGPISFFYDTRIMATNSDKNTFFQHLMVSHRRKDLSIDNCLQHAFNLSQVRLQVFQSHRCSKKDILEVWSAVNLNGIQPTNCRSQLETFAANASPKLLQLLDHGIFAPRRGFMGIVQPIFLELAGARAPCGQSCDGLLHIFHLRLAVAVDRSEPRQDFSGIF